MNLMGSRMISYILVHTKSFNRREVPMKLGIELCVDHFQQELSLPEKSSIIALQH